MGKTKTPDGKTMMGGKKTRFNKDDSGPFQSDLTYHDFAFNTVENSNEGQGQQDQQNKKRRTLFAFVSSHGGVTAEGGSSRLERTVFQYHQQYAKEEEKDKAQKDDEQKGIKFRDVFKITTQEVFEAEDGNKGKGKKKEEPDKVERWELRPEVQQAVEEVGKESYETIAKSGRDEGAEDDPTVMPNLTFLYEAANRATEAWWNSTLANLGQRRANRGIKPGSLPDRVQLSEAISNCDQWSGAIRQALAQANPQEQEALQKDIARMAQQCKQMVQVPYNVVNPKFEEDDGQNGGGQLKAEGAEKEDPLQRDARNQLEVLAKAGIRLNELPSNWKYNEKDEKAPVTVYFDENAQPQGETPLRVDEQLSLYNQSLQSAAQGIEEIKTRIPDLKMGNPLDYQIAPKSRSVKDINRPTESQWEEFGSARSPQRPEARTYEQLVQKSQSN